MYIKKCEKDLNLVCKNRQDKAVLCCLDDMAEEVELLYPSLDAIISTIENGGLDKFVFSKLMFVTDMINTDNETDLKIKHIIKSASYFCFSYESMENTDCLMLGKSFVNESLKWYKHKLFDQKLDDIDVYLTSLTTDYKTIKTMLDTTEQDSYEDNDDDMIFF